MNLPWLEGVKALSAIEADDLKENLIEALESCWQGADEIISQTNKLKAEAVIWRLIDREDTEFLANGILRVARKVPAAAFAVRKISEASKLFRAGVIVAPRFIDTVRFYAAHGGFVII